MVEKEMMSEGKEEEGELEPRAERVRGWGARRGAAGWLGMEWSAFSASRALSTTRVSIIVQDVGIADVHKMS